MSTLEIVFGVVAAASSIYVVVLSLRRGEHSRKRINLDLGITHPGGMLRSLASRNIGFPMIATIACASLAIRDYTAQDRSDTTPEYAWAVMIGVSVLTWAMYLPGPWRGSTRPCVLFLVPEDDGADVVVWFPYSIQNGTDTTIDNISVIIQYPLSHSIDARLGKHNDELAYKRTVETHYECMTQCHIDIPRLRPGENFSLGEPLVATPIRPQARSGGTCDYRTIRRRYGRLPGFVTAAAVRFHVYADGCPPIVQSVSVFIFRDRAMDGELVDRIARSAWDGFGRVPSSGLRKFTKPFSWEPVLILTHKFFTGAFQPTTPDRVFEIADPDSARHTPAAALIPAWGYFGRARRIARRAGMRKVK